MRAAVLTEYGEPLSIEERDVPQPTPDGAVIEVEACGICRSDWHGWQGDWEWFDGKPPLGQVLGHEPAGTVVEVGERVRTVSEGDRVAIPFNIGDGTCPTCRRGLANICENTTPIGFAIPGAFAEAVAVPAADHNLVSLPSDVSAVEMAGLGCRFMTAFHGLANRATLSGGETVAVYGCGGVGLSAVAIADALGASVIAVDLRDEALDRAEALGADAVVNGRETDDAPSAVRALSDGGAHVAVDALGIAETCRNAARSLRRRGRHVQIGLTTSEERGEVALPIDTIVQKEISVLGSHGMAPAHYDELLSMVSSGRLDPGAIVSEEVGLEDVSDVLASMTDFDTVGIPVVTSF